MQTVGERLTAAREKMGISLRDAAEVTKIRSDFLGHLEADEFDFDLPEIYKRGFVKNYARFLKLDPEVIVADYSAQRLGSSRAAARRAGASDLFGQIDLQPSARKSSPAAPASEPPRSAPVEASRSSSPDSGPAENAMAGRVDDVEDGDKNGRDAFDYVDKMLLLKIGTIVTGTIVSIFLIVWLFSVMRGSGQITEVPRDDAPSERQTTAPATMETVSLHATGNVRVLVQQIGADGQPQAERFRSDLAAGETRTFETGTPFRVLFTAGENLEIEFQGDRVRPSRAGAASIVLP